MATFPRREADIARLSDAFFDGIARHQQDFPSIHFIPLFIANRDYKAARRSLLRIRADARQASQARKNSLRNLVTVMKRCLILSEIDTAGDPVKLGFIGWGPPAAARGMTAPNAPRNLTARRTSQGDIMLQWTGPSKTGNNPRPQLPRPAAIDRPEQNAGPMATMHGKLRPQRHRQTQFPVRRHHRISRACRQSGRNLHGKQYGPRGTLEQFNFSCSLYACYACRWHHQKSSHYFNSAAVSSSPQARSRRPKPEQKILKCSSFRKRGGRLSQRAA